MAGQAETNRVSLFVSPEVLWGETPGVAALAPKMYEIRMTSESLIHNKATVLSEVIRSDRMRDFIAEVGASAEGDIAFELAFQNLDLLLEAQLANDYEYLVEILQAAGIIDAVTSPNEFTSSTDDVFTGFVVGAEVWIGDEDGTNDFPVNADNNGRFVITAVDNGAGTTALTVATTNNQNNALVAETPATQIRVRTNMMEVATDIFTTTPDKIGSTTHDFVADMNLRVGQYIKTKGFATGVNNGVFKITVITANLLTLDTAAILTEGAATLVTFSGKQLKNGTALKSLLVEKKFDDITEFLSLQGVRAGEMTLSVESGAIVTGTVSTQGKQGLAASVTVSGNTIPGNLTDAMNATTNVGTILEGSTPVALTTAIRAIELNMNNNLRTKPVIASKFPVDVGYGFFEVGGSITVYFEDIVLYNKFIAHTESSLSFRFTDSAGNVMQFTVHRLFFSEGNPVTPGGNDDVILALTFSAIRDSTENSVMNIDLLQA